MNEQEQMDFYGDGYRLMIKSLSDVLINIELVKHQVYPSLLIDMKSANEYMKYKEFVQKFMQKIDK